VYAAITLPPGKEVGMTVARETQINLDSTRYYHCISRCVRRAFLCGEDPVTRKNFDHRKEWVVEKLAFLAEQFSINVCAYAVMSNHIHLVLEVDNEACIHWSNEEVISRTSALYRSAFKEHESWPAEMLSARIEVWRHRLYNISWFMAGLSESIARKANKEDDCKGRFWEGRFKSQALLDEGALLACMAYVDLNPIRAGISTGLETSDWTSIQQRLREFPPPTQDSAVKNSEKTPKRQMDSPSNKTKPALAQFQDKDSTFNETRQFNMEFLDYVGLLEWTGRQVRSDKTGFISKPPTKLLNTAGLNVDAWIDSLEGFNKYSVLVGSSRSLDSFAPAFGRRWVKGKWMANKMYQSAA